MADERGVKYVSTYKEEDLTLDNDPALMALRAWCDEQRRPLTEDELAQTCSAAVSGCMALMRTMIKVQLRTVFALELLIFGAGITVGLGLAFCLGFMR